MRVMKGKVSKENGGNPLHEEDERENKQIKQLESYS